MLSIRRELESALAGTSPILIVGESGTGKTLLAQAVAEASHRRSIVGAVLGSSDDLNTITSELFGHERGAYSGASGKRPPPRARRARAGARRGEHRGASA
jgi:DNA-binding NtrC family response regulator